MKQIEMLDALFENATEGIIVTNFSGTIVLVNPTALKLFGYKKSEFLGLTVEALIPSRMTDKHVEHRHSYVKHPHNRSMGAGLDLYAMRKDQSEFPVAISLSPFETSEGKFIMSFITDITERKRINDELKSVNQMLQEKTEEVTRFNNQLEQKVKERTEELGRAITELAKSKNEVLNALDEERKLNELKSNFISTASHEFRTPLSTILSSASLIGKYKTTAEDDKRQKHIQRIKSTVVNLTEILNDFLSLDKLEEGVIRVNPEKIDYNELINTVIDEMLSHLKSNQTITKVIIKEYNPYCYADPKLVRNILINLCSNAIKYSPEGKPIIIEVNYTKDSFSINIIDKGIGIPMEDQEHLFERFFRANNATNIQGTGLGLNIVKKYLDLMEGEITYTSDTEKGSVFTINIPQ